uniref:Rubrerythrin diiron-binding domain-containing protein n=1 Tax=candidate division WOR-3 bacterium TaxID=2052148 RepID=A0A7C4CBS7_UNCW3
MKYTLLEVLEMAVQTEKAGRAFYQTAARATSDRNTGQVFLFLADEEEKHIRTFEDLARAVKETPEEQPWNWAEAALYLKAITDSRYFLDESKALALAREAATPAQAVTVALGFEKETLLFYNQLLDMVGPAAMPTVGALIAEEKKHICRLQELKETLDNPAPTSEGRKA